MNILKLQFCATECNGLPSLRFCINNDIQQEFTFTETESTVDLIINLLDGKHELEIERYGKTDNNTLIDSAGQILQDQTVTLVDMFLDGIKLPDRFKYSGVFHYNDQSIQSGLVWGPNGKYIFKFETPMITWVIQEQYHKQIDTSLEMFIPDAANAVKVLTELEKFENMINGAHD
jgi:hypothetical protein